MRIIYSSDKQNPKQAVSRTYQQLPHMCFLVVQKSDDLFHIWSDPRQLFNRFKELMASQPALV